MIGRVSGFATVILCGMADPSIGCEWDVLTKSEAQKADTRIEMRADCSFENVDTLKPFDDLPGWTKLWREGGPVRDRGNGRIAQRLSKTGMCSSVEALLFVDCNTGESLILFGDGVPPSPVEVAGASFDSIETIQPPYGPISIGPTSSVDELFETANKHGIKTMSPSEYLQKASKRDRYDATCGCKLFYPDSPTAGQ